MSTPLATDEILVERSSTVYRCTKTDWDTGAPAGGSATNALTVQAAWGQIAAGYNASGRHVYHSSLGASLFWIRTDASGSYTLSSPAGNHSTNGRPNTKLKVDGTWYQIGTVATASGTSTVGPFNAYYRRSVVSWTYSAAELVAAIGATSGSIQGIQIYCYQAPTGSYNLFPSYVLGAKLISAGSITTNYSGTTGGSFTQVYSHSNKSWTGSIWNEMLFSSAISWG